jgi:uncharacterized protein (TIGR02597 family)
MNTKAIFTTLAAMVATSLVAQQVTTEPVGFVSVAVPANSDAILAVPLNRASEFKGSIQSISGNVVTVVGAPAWAVNQFVYNASTQLKTYALQLASGTKEGLTAKITANTANSVTVTLDASEDYSGVATEAANGTGNGTQVDIVPYWTPSSLITSTVAQDSQILLLNSTSAGVNLSSSASYGYDSGNWYDDTFNPADNTPLAFGTAFIFRNGGVATTLSMVGSVPMNKHRVVLRTRASNTDQDIAIGFSSPVPTTVGSLGLTFAEDDQILVFNNSATGQNKSAVATLYYTTADGWVNDSFSPVGNTYMLQPGQGYIFRKKGTPTAQALVWTALQPYLQ